MALWVCAGEGGCGTKYAVGLFRCPRCHNTEFFEDGDPMAKITRHGGPSDKTLPVPESAAAAEPVSAGAAAADHAEALDVTEHVAGPAQPVEVRGEHGPELVETEGGEESSPGSNSSASTETQPTNSEPSSKTRPRRARKTANPSEKDPTASSTAPSTAGDQESGTSTSAADSEAGA